MKTFNICVVETLREVVSVEAESLDEAIAKVETQYKDEDIVLCAENHEATAILPHVSPEELGDVLANEHDQRQRISSILKLIGVTPDSADMIAAEMDPPQCKVNMDYLRELKIPAYLRFEIMKYIGMFYAGSFE